MGPEYVYTSSLVVPITGWGIDPRDRDLVLSLNRGGPQYRPQNTTVLIMGTPKMVPLILVNPHLGAEVLKVLRWGVLEWNRRPGA